jgi:uncharacterized protein
MEFEWDASKEQVNLKKHGVSFDEAQTVFNDENALFMGDPDHSVDESRFVILGLSNALRALVVCHCYRENDSMIRIISARKADKREQRQYSRRNQP